MLIDKIFDKRFFEGLKTEELVYPLKKNQFFRAEIEEWLKFFRRKKWDIEKKLRHAKSFDSLYSKLNELRAGYFLENFCQVELLNYEYDIKEKNTNIEFRGILPNQQQVFIEVKTPLIRQKNRWKKSNHIYSFWHRDESSPKSKNAFDLIKEASSQLPNNHVGIVILSDALDFSLLDSLRRLPNELGVKEMIIMGDQNDDEVWEGLVKFKNINCLMILGNLFREDFYKNYLIFNESAQILLEEKYLVNNYLIKNYNL